LWVILCPPEASRRIHEHHRRGSLRPRRRKQWSDANASQLQHGQPIAACVVGDGDHVVYPTLQESLVGRGNEVRTTGSPKVEPEMASE
jgi:hypothetical protein